MKRFALALLLILSANAVHAQTPKPAAKPVKPEFIAVTPRAAQIGGERMVTVTGKHFTEDMQALASHPGLKAAGGKDEPQARPGSDRQAAREPVGHAHRDRPA
jgi:hypothetical protein